MENDYKTQETEYSKKWVIENKELFAKDVLEFMEQHPAPFWKLSIKQTNGFITLTGQLK